MASVKGTFGTYNRGSRKSYPDDEEAAQWAIEDMLGMCGNPGQEAMIGDHAEDFFDWAIQALEEEAAYATGWTEFSQMVLEEWYGGRIDMWQATEAIWGHGWTEMADQAGAHDSRDEYGEGTGQPLH